MNYFQGGHIQIMVNATEESLDFKSICRTEMKKKVQYSIVFVISRSTPLHMLGREGPACDCKDIGAVLFTLEEFCRLGRLEI